MSQARSIVRPTPRPPVQPLAHAARANVLPAVSSERSFKVLQPSRTSAQLSLFPPQALAQRGERKKEQVTDAR